MDAIKGIRNIRGEMNIPPSKKARAVIRVTGQETGAALRDGENYIKSLAHVSSLEYIDEIGNVPEKAMAAVITGAEIYLPLEGLVDIEKEIERLKKEKKNLEGELARINGKLASKGFLTKAPAEVVQKEKEKKKDYQDRMKKIIQRLEMLS